MMKRWMGRMMDHNGCSVGDWPGDVWLRRCLFLQSPGCECSVCVRRTTSGHRCVFARLTCVNFAAVGREDEDSPD